MTFYKVKTFVSRSGEDLAVLTDGEGMPWYWPNVFATVEYRKSVRSVNTRIKVLRSLGMSRMWATTLGRDFDHDIIYGDFLSLEDVEGLADFLRLPSHDQGRLLSRAFAPPAPPPRTVVRFEDFRPDYRGMTSPDHVENNPVETAARIRWVASYMEWHLRRRVGGLERRRLESATILSLGEAAVGRLRQLAPRVSARSDDELSLEGVDESVLSTIEAALVPGADGNPFTPGFVQLRNYLVWRLLLDTGARRAEVREAKVDHIKFSTRRFEIHTSKTNPRTVGIGSKAAEAFDQFIEYFWSKLPLGARRRGYLFTEAEGQHLSLRAINRIFETVREKVPGVPDFMGPHTIRRSWNDRLSAKIDRLPPNTRPLEEEEIKMRNRLQGWTGESSMGARYAKRHIRRKADEVAQKLIDDLEVNHSIPKRTNE